MIPIRRGTLKVKLADATLNGRHINIICLARSRCGTAVRRRPPRSMAECREVGLRAACALQRLLVPPTTRETGASGCALSLLAGICHRSGALYVQTHPRRAAVAICRVKAVSFLLCKPNARAASIGKSRALRDLIEIASAPPAVLRGRKREWRNAVPTAVVRFRHPRSGHLAAAVVVFWYHPVDKRGRGIVAAFAARPAPRARTRGGRVCGAAVSFVAWAGAAVLAGGRRARVGVHAVRARAIS